MVAPTGIRRVKPAASKVRVAASKEVVKRVTSTIHQQKPNPPSAEEIKDEILSDREFPEGHPPAYVQVAAGGTYSLGNFEFVKLDVSVTLPCRPDEVRQTMEIAGELAQEGLQAEEVTWGIGSGGK